MASCTDWAVVLGGKVTGAVVVAMVANNFKSAAGTWSVTYFIASLMQLTARIKSESSGIIAPSCANRASPRLICFGIAHSDGSSITPSRKPSRMRVGSHAPTVDGRTLVFGAVKHPQLDAVDLPPFRES